MRIVTKMRNPTKKIPIIRNKVIAKIDKYITNIKMATKVTKIRIETKKSFQKHNENNSNQKTVSSMSGATKKMKNLRYGKVLNGFLLENCEPMKNLKLCPDGVLFTVSIFDLKLRFLLFGLLVLTLRLTLADLSSSMVIFMRIPSSLAIRRYKK